MTGLDQFWAGYESTLRRIIAERPATVDALVAILNAFQQPSAGLAFFGNNADTHLSDALDAAGWSVSFIEGDYLWEAQHGASGEVIHYVEGDVYRGDYRHASEGR